MPVFTNSKSPFWQFDFKRAGHRFCGSFNGNGKPRIVKERPKREAERAEAILRTLDKPDDKQRMTIHDANTKYWTESAQHFADSSGEWGRLAHMERLLGKNTYLDDLTDGDLSSYVSRRRGETARNKKTPPANATINRELETLGRILKRARKPWAVRLPDVELAVHKLPEPKERVRSLTTDEDAALLAAVDKLRPDFRDMIEFALLTGKRLSEVILLEKRRIDRKAMEARVIQKGGQEIAIALTNTSLAIIERNWMNHPTYIFTYVCRKNKTGDKRVHRKGLRYPFSPDGWRKPWKALLKEAKIQDFRFHDLRHTTGTRILSATGNLKSVQSALGHADIASSARYAHTSTDQTRAALEAAEKSRRTEPSRNDAPQTTNQTLKSGA